MLVNSPVHLSHFFPTPPTSLLTIATILENAGFNVGICDVQAEKMPDETANPLTQKEFEYYIRHQDPQIVGISCFTENYACALKAANICKQINPDITTIIGGPHVTFRAKQTLEECSSIDYVVRGEGEITMLHLVSTLTKGENPKKVKGITFRIKDKVVETENRPFTNLAELPPPSYHLVDLSHYGNGTMIECGRGCPFKCAFCCSSAQWHNSIRFHSAKNIFNQMEFLLSEYKLKWLSFSDLTFTLNHKRTINLLDKLLHLGMPNWSVQTRVDCVSKKLLEKMSASNCVSIAFGVEDIHKNILSAINKNVDFKQILKAVRLARKLGIKVNANFIVGLPKQTRKDILENVEFAKREIDQPSFPTLTPFPGSEIGENPSKFGLKILTKEWTKYDLSHPIVETEFLNACSQEILIQEINETLYSNENRYHIGFKITDW